MNDYGWGLTSIGFRRPTYTELLDALEYKARELWGAAANLTVRSPLGLFLRIYAWMLNILFSGEVDAFRGTNRYKWVHDNCEQVTDEDIAFLAALPQHMSFEADGAAYLMQHQMLDNSYDMPESVQTFDAFWRVWYAGESRPERRMIFGHTHRRLVHRLDNDRLWLNPGSASYRRPDDRDKRAHYMLIEDGDIRFGAVEYDRSVMLARAMDYVKKGTMLETDLQDAMFFFGDAPTSREPLPR